MDRYDYMTMRRIRTKWKEGPTPMVGAQGLFNSSESWLLTAWIQSNPKICIVILNTHKGRMGIRNQLVLLKMIDSYLFRVNWFFFIEIKDIKLITIKVSKVGFFPSKQIDCTLKLTYILIICCKCYNLVS